jgi:hypothetical protein
VRTKASTILGLAGAVLVSAAAHAAPPPGFTLVAQTEHFSYYTRGHLKVDVDKSERFLAHVESVLGVTVESRAEFYRHDHAAELAALTGRYVSGFTDPATGRIDSTLEFHPHELVHRVAAELGDPGHFFHEGLAVALSSGGKWNGQRLDRAARSAIGRGGFQMVVDGFGRIDADRSYPVAGAFVAYLIRSDGIAKVAEFFRHCRTERDRDSAFAAVFGRSLAEAGEAWTASL